MQVHPGQGTPGQEGRAGDTGRVRLPTPPELGQRQDTGPEHQRCDRQPQQGLQHDVGQHGRDRVDHEPANPDEELRQVHRQPGERAQERVPEPGQPLREEAVAEPEGEGLEDLDAAEDEHQEKERLRENDHKPEHAEAGALTQVVEPAAEEVEPDDQGQHPRQVLGDGGAQDGDDDLVADDAVTHDLLGEEPCGRLVHLAEGGVHAEER